MIAGCPGCNEKTVNVALRVINILETGNLKLLGGFLKETPNPPLKATSGFVNLIRISDTSVLEHI